MIQQEIQELKYGKESMALQAEFDALFGEKEREKLIEQILSEDHANGPQEMLE